MSFEEQIQAAVAGGVGKAGIEALLGIKLEGDLLAVYEKAKAIKQLKKASGQQKLTVQQPKRGSLIVPNNHNS